MAATRAPDELRSAGFAHRIGLATKFEADLFGRLERMGFRVALTGAEHVCPDLHHLLRCSTDQTSLAVRHAPDGVAAIGCPPRSLYVDAKAGKSVEKQAWEQYGKLHAAGNRIVLVFGGYGSAWNFLEEVRLLDAYETLLRYPLDRWWPVESGWIAPRLSPEWQRLRSKMPGASGTPYREADPLSLRPWASFNPTVLWRLGLGRTST